MHGCTFSFLGVCYIVRKIWWLAFMRKDGAGLMRMVSYGGGLKSWTARDVGGFGEAFGRS
jgi:hypothetical protein